MADSLSTTAPRSGRVQSGDLWQLGPHRLLCGDSQNPADVARLMNGEHAALTVTSPPYNLGHSATLGRSNAPGKSLYLGQSDARSRADYLRLLCSVTENALQVSTVVILNIQMLAGNKIALVEFLHHFREHLIDVAIWNKGYAPPAMVRNVFNSQFEWLIFLTRYKSKGKTTRAIPTADFRGTVSNVYAGSPQKHNPYFRLHAATFPLHLPLWLIQTFDSQGGIILDPFIGTGTTLLAAEQLGQKCYGIEIEPAYCEIILDRWEQAMHRHAVRRSSVIYKKIDKSTFDGKLSTQHVGD